MKVLKTKVVQLESVVVEESRGLLEERGKVVLVHCINYIYSGMLTNVSDTEVELTKAQVVFETGGYSDKKFKNAQSVQNTPVHLSRGAIESWWTLPSTENDKEKDKDKRNELAPNVSTDSFLNYLNMPLLVHGTNYIYAGVLTGVNGQLIELQEAGVVFDTGEYTGKMQFKDFQKVPSNVYLNKCALESWWVLSK